jgi:hypothetical protein
MQTAMQPLTLTMALTEWVDTQALIGETTILVRDFTCYGDPSGLLVLIDGEEPDGIHNAYRSAQEIEPDLVKVVPGYAKGASIWQEYEDGYDW